MKKVSLCIVGVLFACGICFAGWMSSGGGRSAAVTHTDVTTVTTGTDWAYRAVVYNSSTADSVNAQVNISATAFTNNIALTNVIVIAPSQTYTFQNEHDKSWKITSVLLRSATLTNTVYVGFN